jgi:hypothetical protein
MLCQLQPDSEIECWNGMFQSEEELVYGGQKLLYLRFEKCQNGFELLNWLML